MLTLRESRNTKDCDGISRRDFLQIGALGCGGLTLPWLLQQKALAGSSSSLTNKSVVLLFLSGGASHIETFNPNMDAPAPYCSATGDVQTTVPGLRFGGTFPLLSKHADRMAIVRSFQHPIGGHVEAIVHVLTGGTDSDGKGINGFSMGAMYSRLRGANDPETGMPSFALLNSDEVDPQYRSERGRVERGSRPLALGANFAPFQPGGKGTAVENLSLNMESDRLGERRRLRAELDRLKRRTEQISRLDAVDRYTEQAFDVILGSAAEAFDLESESSELRARYDTSAMQVGKKKFRGSQLGEHFLTARRLIEAGCGFVTVHSAGWDMHADGNNPGIVSGMEMLGRPVDRAVSAFLDDLDQRGMLDDVLLVITGDFGRTPRINDRGGRDHWPKLGTLALAGGGIGAGQIIGQSARKNDEPLTQPVTPGNLQSTIMHTLFDVPTLRLARGVPRDLMRRIEDGRPIEGLHS